MHYSFTKDLVMGHDAEQKVIDRLIERLPACEILERNNDARYDFAVLIDGKRVQIEVKCDLLAPSTKNVAIEFQCRGKWSGIYNTEADVWAYVIGEHIRLVRVTTLRIAHRSLLYRQTRAGDSRVARCVLVPLATFEMWGVAL